MARFALTLGSQVYRFDDLKAVMACASARRSGDELAGIGARSEEERVAARMILADLPLKTFLTDALVPYEADEVTRLIMDTHDSAAFAPVASLTVGGLRDWLLSYEADTAALARLAPGLTPEMAAAVSKLMRNQDLVSAASKCEVVTGFRSTIGRKGCLSSRLQPNHPTDDARGVMASTLDGLRFGIGDAVIGINPAADNLTGCVRLVKLIDELRERFAIPTQSCVLSHVTASIAAIELGA